MSERVDDQDLREEYAFTQQDLQRGVRGKYAGQRKTLADPLPGGTSPPELLPGAGAGERAPWMLADGSVVHRDPEILSGTPVFVGTRVPVQTFIEYLTGGYTVGEFLDNLPSVRREQVSAFLEQATQALLAASGGDESQPPQ